MSTTQNLTPEPSRSRIRFDRSSRDLSGRCVTAHVRTGIMPSLPSGDLNRRILTDLDGRRVARVSQARRVVRIRFIGGGGTTWTKLTSRVYSVLQSKWPSALTPGFELVDVTER